jgi:hypothetical protein
MMAGSRTTRRRRQQRGRGDRRRVTDARAKLEKAMVDARGAVDPIGTREAFGGDAMKRAVSAGFDLHRIARDEIV